MPEGARGCVQVCPHEWPGARVAPCKPALTLGLLTSSPTLKGPCCVTQHAGFPAELLAPGPLHTGVGAQGDEAGRALHSFPFRASRRQH